MAGVVGWKKDWGAFQGVRVDQGWTGRDAAEVDWVEMG